MSLNKTSLNLFKGYFQVTMLASTLLISSCSHYQPHQLTKETVTQQLKTASFEQLTIQADKACFGLYLKL